MTIGIGVLASDGIVIAADSQVTSSIKMWKGKMTGTVSQNIENAADGSLFFSGLGGCAVAVAGRPFAQALSAARLVIRTFDAQKELAGEELRLTLENALLEFYGRYVIPFSAGTDEQQINIQLLIGAWRDNQANLWYSDHNLLAPVSYHYSIGLGGNQADPLLARFTRIPQLDLAQTVLLAGFVVHQGEGREHPLRQVNRHDLSPKQRDDSDRAEHHGGNRRRVRQVRRLDACDNIS